MRTLLLIPLLLFSQITNAGYFYDNYCYQSLEPVKNIILSETINPLIVLPSNVIVRNQILTDYNSTPAIYTTGQTGYTNALTLGNCPETKEGPFCIFTNPVSFTGYSNSFYVLAYKERSQYYPNSSTSTNSAWRIHERIITNCEPSTSFNGFEPVNLSVTYPPDTFNPSNINPVDAASSIGSGFLLLAVPLAVVWAGKRFLSPLFS
jgi:hypothetical protein